jgi:putative DNA primase/helicase
VSESSLPHGVKADNAAAGPPPIVAAALEYGRLGLSVTICCPPDHVGAGKKHAKTCKSPGKAPLHYWTRCQEPEGRLTAAEVTDLFRRHPNANVGAAMTPLLMGVDSDGPRGEPALAEMAGGDLPPTWTFTTHDGVRRLYRPPAGGPLRNSSKPITDGKHEEVRFLCVGTQTVMPPSRHKEGTTYAWVPGLGPGEVELAPMPAWMVELLRDDRHRRNGTAAGTGPAAEIDAKITEGKRHTELVSLAGTMRRRGMSAKEMLAALLVVNEDRCDPPLDEDDVRDIAEDIATRYEPAEAGPTVTIRGTADGTGGSVGDDMAAVHLTDVGNARRVVARYRGNVRYAYAWRQFLVWDGGRWAEDKTGKVSRCVKKTQAGLYQWAAGRLADLAGEEGRQADAE